MSDKVEIEKKMLKQFNNNQLYSYIDYIIFITGEKVSEGLQDSGVYGPCQVVTDKGTTINADVVIRCTGAQVNSQAYATSLSE